MFQLILKAVKIELGQKELLQALNQNSIIILESEIHSRQLIYFLPDAKPKNYSAQWLKLS
jgi:hypothetical protein